MTDPTDSQRTLPGWWTPTGPTGRMDLDFPGGHGNFGLAHGIAGPLAVLAHSARQGISVAGQCDAIATICSWLDAWRIDTDTGARWPYMITRPELTTCPAQVRHSGAARRPSWCYGTTGIARCLQLAALALGDTTRRRIAEAALVSALTDPVHRALTADASLCHGYAGLARIAAHAAADAAEPAASQLRALVPDLLGHALTQPTTATPGRRLALERWTSDAARTGRGCRVPWRDRPGASGTTGDDRQGSAGPGSTRWSAWPGDRSPRRAALGD